ncbi:hypothetical protein CK203_088579 [Vitis vinifera]|uniref:Uncharacterized protein n=1 Tax=Vitis vinifera TaxID=29760 RepID=A0A438F1M7_VITVI|nr:hypothetical protein CK203_088579 [Vitis vinifera]
MMMMMMKDEWIRAAMSDDMVVAELLLRLKQSHASPPLLTPFKWGLRLRAPGPPLDATSFLSERTVSQPDAAPPRPSPGAVALPPAPLLTPTPSRTAAAPPPFASPPPDPRWRRFRQISVSGPVHRIEWFSYQNALRSGGNYSHVRSDLFTFSSRLFSGYLSFLLACHQEELFIKLTKTPFRGRGLRFVRWSIVSGGWEQLSAMTRVYEGIVTYLDDPIIIHRQFRKGLNFGLRWEALITRDSGDNHRHHSSMLGAWRDLSPYSNHSYDWQSDGRGLMGEGGVSCDVGWNGWPPVCCFFMGPSRAGWVWWWQSCVYPLRLCPRLSSPTLSLFATCLSVDLEISNLCDDGFWGDFEKNEVTALSETTNTNTKRSRRKKTFAELKEEEILLLKERTYLKKELATLRVTFKEQRATNESLKRMKCNKDFVFFVRLPVINEDRKKAWIDFHLNLVKGTGAAATDEAKEAIPREEPHKMEGPSEDHAPSIVPVQALSNDLLQSESCQVKMNDAPRDNVFMLPDLNMMAMEDDIGSETLLHMAKELFSNVSRKKVLLQAEVQSTVSRLSPRKLP